jgi:hypothetical protein
VRRTLQAILGRLRRDEPVVIVSGLPRSGTSMVMKMLEAGGVGIHADGVRQADEDNPRGYFELERVKSLQKQTDRGWIKEARGKALKVISQLLTELPAENRYEVLFIHRNLHEVIASQNKMLARRGEPVDPTSDERMQGLFEQHLKKIKSWLAAHQNFKVLELEYSRIVADPVSQADRIRKFLRRDLDVDRMATVVEKALYRNRAGVQEPTRG